MLRISRIALGAVQLIPFLTPSNALSIEKRAVVIPSKLPGSWVSQGCYVSDVPGRTLTGGGYASDTLMTDEACITYCQSNGFVYAGTEYSSQCYCGAVLAAGAGPATSTDCSMPCTGNTTEACGGPNRLNLFWSGTTGPQTNPGPGLWNFVGCYAEGTTGRALPNGVGTTGGSAALTVSLCTSACQTAGYVLAGVEYSGECYCANTVQNGGILAPDGLTGCNMLCNGNKSEFCGGGGRLNLYDYNHAVTLPPYTTISTTSSTSTSISIAASSSSSTSSSHSTTCTSSHGSSTSSSTSSHSTTCTSSHANSVLSSSSSSSSLDPVSSSSTSSSKPASSSTSSSASAVPTLSHKTTIGAYTLMGCYSEATTGRALTGKSFYDYPTMTLEECSTQCSGFTYFGVEYGGECYCGNSINTGCVIENIGDCSFICPGSQYEYCGAGNRLEMYQLSSLSSPSSSSSSSLKPSSSTSSTISSSSSKPASSSSSISSTQPYPSTSPSSSGSSVSSTKSSSSSSSSPHSASVSSTSSSLSSSVSSFSSTGTSTSSSATSSPTLSHKPIVGAYTYQGCYSEATNSRALTGSAFYDYQAMTIEECAAQCSAFIYFGVEYGGECYCGNALQAGSTLQTLTDCSFICPGNAFEYCGAGSRLELYKNSNAPSTPTTSASTGTPTTPSVPSTPPIGNFAYQGCYIDGANGRILNHQQPDNQNLTPENCVALCAANQYTIAGVEYGVQCFCDTAIYNGGALDPNQGDCTTPCSGNANEMCGGPNGRMNLYSVGTPQVYVPPSIQKTGLPTNWTYSGCLEDNIPSAELASEILSTFPYMVWNSATANTPALCIAACQEYGYNAAGLEYGSECFCGDVENIVTASAPGVQADPRTVQYYTRSRDPKLVDESLCNSPCSGDPTKLCGSGNLMSYYSWNGTDPLYSFGFPTGEAAGEYSLLIGGVTVPLMTAQVVTGKVLFTEKFGTQESNGTGAYELDLSEINNWDAAWRTLYGLQTDVFCSAGLILPDKAGRHMTIGGWFGESNFGVRLFTPDGSDGVQGVSEWEEDPGALSLQVPRWYPSALTMANGSILIVGGEIASNAAEQPTLEILPATGVPEAGTISGYSNTTVYLDFLDRTAPFNLYPFICVLPTGGIFIAYFNEARILDEGTFATTRTLPNMPGSVNNPFAGRTYQLEGTMVLLPQYAPYHDHLQVLICGGSTAVGDDGDPIDNCISTAPEDPEPVWTIERMPSRRVMSCMAGLPDGTYLILNGAQHGKAGFGLGASPNYNAVLYDPKKPVNQRMSIMANTTVARLYHSEAIVLLDGRVLVSGSDPSGNYNDPVDSFPEEYRVEVFTPPYLLSGLPRPTFHLSNTDWDYNNIITFTLTSGNNPGLQVSMLGAVVSTHGNNMGQRTLFPAVVCAGNTCQITAPPNAHVAPPGWYMLFVLNAQGTPSIGQFIRLGKDPANIGNWPQGIPGITPPGV